MPKADSTEMICELEVPVPWGHIAAKSWNDPCGSPIIAVHGLQDNAGTFDRLIPLLPSSFYYVGIDLPGHGRSSHLPRGILLNFMDYVTTIKRVIDHFKWGKCIYLGHSLGGMLGFFFASLFPENISKLIIIDSFIVPISQDHSLLKRHRILFDKTVNQERKFSSHPAPIYTYDQALQRLVENRPSRLTNEAAAALIKRSLVETSGGYRFTVDQRLKFGLKPLMYMDEHVEVIDNIRCPVLTVLASETVGFYEVERIDSIVKVYKSKPNCNFTIVEGNHDVHNNHPDRVAPHITEFLIASRCLL